MLVKIFGTVFSKTFASVANFIIVILTAKYLGAAARGEISLVILSVSIVALFQAIVGGPSLTYYAATNSLKKLLGIAVSWSLLIGILVSVLLGVFQLLSWDLMVLLLLIALPQGIILIYQSILIGRQKIAYYNTLEFIRSAFLVLIITSTLLGFDVQSVSVVYNAYVAANIVTVALGTYYILKLPRIQSDWSIVTLAKEMLRFGFQVQLNNISQMFNYRFVYFVIEKWKGLEVLGVFSVAISIAETVWIVTKSIATYQTSILVNTKDRIRQRTSTISFAKMSLFFTTIAVSILLLLPESLFIWLFGEEFIQIKQINYFFSPAILFLSFFGILNHYFYSTDRNKVNIYGALVGNIITLVVSIYLIENYGLVGAALTYSLAFLGMLFYLFFQFLSISNAKYTDFSPRISDIQKFKKLFKAQ
jgi:O-antigen/teichoic acid export membrane protein